jgi:catechol 2,3-dioxygenase-like lactoylglutathione lyase family enzyme
MKILGLDHVQLAIPVGGEGRARAFYRDVLGMEEVPKPNPLVGRGGCWFATGKVQLHLGVEEDFRSAKKAHPALVVEGLDEIVDRCAKAGFATKPDASIDSRRRVHIFDPFGNRIELIEPKRE